jgi:hypothetical protein
LSATAFVMFGLKGFVAILRFHPTVVGKVG